MARFDRIADFMVKQQGTKFSMKNDENSYLFTPTGSRPLNQLLTFDEIRMIVDEILPEALREKFSEDCYLEFPMRCPHGLFAVQVERDPENIQVTILVSEEEIPVIAEPRRRVVDETIVGEPAIIPELTAPVSEPAAQPQPEPARKAPHPFIPPVPGVVPSAAVAAVQVRPPGQYLENLFRYMVKNAATDLHLSAGTKPFVRIDGRLRRLDEFPALPHEQLQDIVWQIVPEVSRSEFLREGQTNFAQDAGEQLRLRCNLYRDNDGVGAVIRLVPRAMKSWEEWDIPKAVVDLCLRQQGLILVSGPARSGKSTTIAALVDFINQKRECHILTLESSVEFIHRTQKSLVNQRQIGLHVASYGAALEAAFHEDPDVCVIDDLSDREVIQAALKLVQTGRLVLGSLFTKTTMHTVQHLVEQFPDDQKAIVTSTLAMVLLGVSSQALCRKEGGGQVAAFEVLLSSPKVCDTIRAGLIRDIPSMIRAGRKEQMVSLNDSLVRLVREEGVSPAEAYEKSVEKDLLLEHFRDIGISFDPRLA